MDQHPERHGSCHCLCGTHGDQPGICISVAMPGLEITYGDMAVAHCRPCWRAKDGQPRQPSATMATALRSAGMDGPDEFRWDGTGEPWTP